ncbi:hypothetical protein GCM10020220_107240 [Nonomuraea rubra]
MQPGDDFHGAGASDNSLVPNRTATGQLLSHLDPDQSRTTRPLSVESRVDVYLQGEVSTRKIDRGWRY